MVLKQTSAWLACNCQAIRGGALLKVCRLFDLWACFEKDEYSCIAAYGCESVCSIQKVSCCL